MRAKTDRACSKPRGLIGGRDCHTACPDSHPRPCIARCSGRGDPGVPAPPDSWTAPLACVFPSPPALSPLSARVGSCQTVSICATCWAASLGPFFSADVPAVMQSVNDTLATAPGELDGAADGSDTSASDGEVSELFTREATGLYRVRMAFLCQVGSSLRCGSWHARFCCVFPLQQYLYDDI